MIQHSPTGSPRPSPTAAASGGGGPPHDAHAASSTSRSPRLRDRELPQEWTDAQRAGFIDAEADKMTWMARAHAATLRT